MTLEPGDVILTGTPAGSRPVQPGDVVEVEVCGRSTVRTTIADSTEPLSAVGPAPKLTPADRAAAVGANAPRPVELTDELRSLLSSVSTATLTSQLQRRGIRSTFFTGLAPLQPGDAAPRLRLHAALRPAAGGPAGRAAGRDQRAEAGRGVDRPGRGAGDRGPGAGRRRHHRRHPRHAGHRRARGRRGHGRLRAGLAVAGPHVPARLRPGAARGHARPAAPPPRHEHPHRLRRRAGHAAAT